MKRRELHSFLISLNVHIWAVALLSLAWVTSRPEPEPEKLRVELVRLPAPNEGALAPDAPARVERDAYDLPPLAGLKPAADRAVRHQERPTVTARVTVSPYQPPRVVSSPRAETRTTRSASERTSINRVAPVVSDAPATRRPDDRSTSRLNLEPGGDPRPLVAIIQARIDAVTPLVHRVSEGCRFEEGRVRLVFVVDRAGYPCGYRILSNTGCACLHKEVDNVLHLAEPYPYVAGWIPVTVKFTL